jgi:hypothetical protein
VTEVEPRILAAWREWLTALASDPEAAIAAAQVYGALSSDGRDAWLAALEEDAPKLGVPRVAIYAPLLSVESDPGRLELMRAAMSEEAVPISPRSTVALRGLAPDRSRVVQLVAPLYASFVQVLTCRFTTTGGFSLVQLDPIRRISDAPKHGDVVESVTLELTPLHLVVEELALAILAQRRNGEELPSTMLRFADLFDATTVGDDAD